MRHHFTLDLADEAATLALSARAAPAIQAGMVINLYGDLGAGKTTWVRGLLHALGHTGKVKSPTYTLLESYSIQSHLSARLMLHHFDLYRFNDPQEWDAAGFRECFNTDSICVIEWPEKAHQVLPVPDLKIKLSMGGAANNTAGEIGRVIEVSAHTELGHRCIDLIDKSDF